MRGFYIEKLVITGANKEPSVVEFCKGLNFIIGPSNTGKSYIMECFDYLFGFEEKANKPFRFEESYGYDCFTIFTCTERGRVILTRKLHKTRISVSSTDPYIESDEYSISLSAKKSINTVWLKMIGIHEPHKILATKGGKTQSLSWRSMMHMFFLKQDYVSRTASVLINPSNVYQDTPSKASLLFLLTGEDAEKVVKPEDKTIKTAKKDAVMGYIKETIKRLVLREEELTNLRYSYENVDLQSNMNAIVAEIENVQRQMDASIEESKQLMKSIYDNNGKLAECNTISSKFNILRKQYQSDIERLVFVVDGEQIKAQIPQNRKCPFCESSIMPHKSESYIEASKAELNHIRIHLKELEKAEGDLSSKQNTIQTAINELEEKKLAIDEHVSNFLAPRISDLKEKLDSYRRVIELSKEIDIIQEEERKYSAELLEKESETSGPDVVYEIKEDFSREDIMGIEDKLIAILKEVNIGGYSSARLNMNTFDLEIAGRHKSIAMGGGYCGILNTILALALMEYLEEDGEYTPNFLMVDSSVSQLSEPEHVDKANSITAAFVSYLVSHAQNGQKIFIEHKDKFPYVIQETENVKVIEFTKNKNHGRYGLLNGVYELER